MTRFVVVVSLCFISSPLFAAGHDACRPDAKKLCGGPVTNPASAKCLTSHEDKLSAACKAKIEEKKQG
jgi:hypothetical protein